MKFWLKTETNKEEPLIKEIKSEMDKSGLDDEVDALSRFEVRIDEI